MSIEVRQARLSDWPALASFLAEAYGDLALYKGEERWTWQFVSNPSGDRANGSFVPVWIALDGDRVVGQIAVQEASLKVEDHLYNAGWIVDVMILPGYRGQGLGHRLHAAVVDSTPLSVTLTMAPATRRLAEKAGCITLGPVRQFTRWTRLDPDAVYRYMMVRTSTRPLLRTWAGLACRIGLFHRFVPPVINPLLRLRNTLQRSRLRVGPTEIVEVDRFDENIDSLWQRVRRDYPVIFPRERRYLNWRFVDCPQLKYRRFVACRNGQTVGYVVLRRCEPVELPLGVIVDLFAARHDLGTVEDLLRHTVRFFGDEVAALDCATSIPEFETTLRRFGFFATRIARPTCVCADEDLRARLQDLNGDWFFSKGDHDWDQIHLA